MLEMGKSKRAILISCALLLGFSTAGCRESEQGRVRELQKGTYLGKPDQPLAGEQIDELRLRAWYQRN